MRQLVNLAKFAKATIVPRAKFVSHPILNRVPKLGLAGPLCPTLVLTRADGDRILPGWPGGGLGQCDRTGFDIARGERNRRMALRSTHNHPIHPSSSRHVRLRLSPLEER